MRHQIKHTYLLLSFGSLAIIYLALELIFPHILNYVPLTMYNALQAEIRILGQSSKVSVIPKNYIALVGDSYAQGQGDWLKQTIKSSKYTGTNPDYYSGHIIFRKTGTDVITYGRGGAASVKGLVSAPIISHLYINSLWSYTLGQPKRILIYFYEGNDFTGNYIHYKNRFLFKGYDENYFFKGYDKNLFYDSQYFDQYLQKEALERYPAYKNDSSFRHLILGSFLSTGWVNLKNEVKRGTQKIKHWFNIQEKSSEASFQPKLPSILRVSLNNSPKQNSLPHNTAVKNGKNVSLPAPLQGPPVNLSTEQMKKSVYIFERSLLFMARFFHQSKISIIYIPGTASIYSVFGPTVTYVLDGNITATNETITKVGREGCKNIYAVAKRNGFQFLDTRPYLRELAQTKLLYGPEDYDHLNHDGQILLAEVIIKQILSGSVGNDNNACRS